MKSFKRLCDLTSKALVTLLNLLMSFTKLMCFCYYHWDTSRFCINEKFSFCYHLPLKRLRNASKS